MSDTQLFEHQAVRRHWDAVAVLTNGKNRKTLAANVQDVRQYDVLNKLYLRYEL